MSNDHLRHCLRSRIKSKAKVSRQRVVHLEVVYQMQIRLGSRRRVGREVSRISSKDKVARRIEADFWISKV